MTVEAISDSVRKRTTRDKEGTDCQSNNSDMPSTTTKQMVPTTKPPNCCVQNKWKIFTIVLGLALITGLLSSVIVVIAHYYNGALHSSDTCLNFVQIKTCLATDSSPYRRYGTKTEYLVAKAEVEAEIGAVAKAECIPILFYLISRHAIRYPDKAAIQEMAVRLPELRDKIRNSTLCNQDLDSLKHWSFQMKPEDDNHVTASGRIQAEKIGKRFKKTFSSLLSAPYSPAIYEFAVTSKPRTTETAEAFAKGLFGKEMNEIKYTVNDYLLHFTKNCSEMLQAKGYQKKKPQEVLDFQNGNVVRLQLNDISKRLGFPVNFYDAEIMYRACVFDFAININKTSPWCAVFTKSDIRVFEYYNDLDDYHDDAYGNRRNYKQACPLIKDMVEQLRKAKEVGRTRKAMMYFTHAGVMKKVIAHLGLYKDNTDLKADGFCTSQGRQWRSSVICPFNSNLALVVYNCGDNKLSVEAYLQEKPVILGGCKKSLCPWPDFEKHYEGATTCDLQKICVP